MPRKYRPWSHNEYDTLEALINEGLSYADIAARMGRETMSVQGTAQRIGLSCRERQGKAHRKHDWHEIDALLEDCIEARMMTVPQAAKRIQALGYSVSQSSLYNRVNQSRELRKQAIHNKRLRMTSVCRRVHRQMAARKAA
ncbi:hypothetical protein [Chromohalobacter sp. 296-RDG]|uniref:hypothetical protein n=1 Tax=Chromohalobacter sp. 296-RDG TaxID=2994062 RepID=UPI0024693E19|nr:hypothetical protein [Chromohalobacter sp. 296-RDG]